MPQCLRLTVHGTDGDVLSTRQQYGCRGETGPADPHSFLSKEQKGTWQNPSTEHLPHDLRQSVLCLRAVGWNSLFWGQSIPFSLMSALRIIQYPLTQPSHFLSSRLSFALHHYECLAAHRGYLLAEEEKNTSVARIRTGRGRVDGGGRGGGVNQRKIRRKIWRKTAYKNQRKYNMENEVLNEC